MAFLHYFSLAFMLVIGIFIGYAGATIDLEQNCKSIIAKEANTR